MSLAIATMKVGRRQVSGPLTAKLGFLTSTTIVVKVGKRQVSDSQRPGLVSTASTIVTMNVGRGQVWGPSTARFRSLTSGTVTVKVDGHQVSGPLVAKLGFYIITTRQTTTNKDNYFELHLIQALPKLGLTLDAWKWYIIFKCLMKKIIPQLACLGAK